MSELSPSVYFEDPNPDGAGDTVVNESQQDDWTDQYIELIEDNPQDQQLPLV